MFIDGGACHGDFTALLLSEFPAAKVHAFEPNAALCSELAGRYADARGVRIWNLALHERAGQVDLRVHADPGTSSLLPRPCDDRRYYHSSDRVVATLPVPAISLDAFVAEHAPDGVGLLKLDTQGSELSILRGAGEALGRWAIDVIYTEFFVVPHYEGAPLLADLMAYLDRYGYSLFDLFKGPNAGNGQLRFGDAIFVSPRVRRRYLDVSPDEP